MNYLLFVYYDNTVKNTEKKTQEIGTKLAKHMSSGQIKFMYGDKHAIFHFGCKGGFEMSTDVITFISEEISGFEYLLTKKGRDYSSNFDKDNLNHLMTLKNTIPKKDNPLPPRLKTINFKNEDGHLSFENEDGRLSFEKMIRNFKKQNVCDMTLDELLDKIGEKGMESLSELEKQKLDEYSKSI